MGRLIGLSAKEQVLDARASTWAGLRAVVADVETTGLNVASSRVVSIALAEIQAGRVLGGYASLVDPGLDRIGASDIHHITTDTLRAANAPAFTTVAPILLDRLTERDDETVLLAGHNVVFDALMLHAELTRLDQALPAIGLLDTKVLAARAGMPASSLSELAKTLGLVSIDEHTAVSDAHITASALLLLADKLRDTEPDLRIEDLATVFDPSVRLSRTGLRRGRNDPPPLTYEHQKAHDADLTTARVRNTALDVCLTEECVELVSRVEDAVTTEKVAETLADWCWQQLDRDDITRATRGRLLTALATAVGRSDDGDLIRAYFDAVTEALPAYGACTPGNACDRCADPDSTRTCRFTAVRYHLIAVFLTRDNELDEERAEAFIPYHDPAKPRGRGRPATGWFGQLVRAGDLDAAGYGAQLAAQAGAQSRRSGREVTLLAQAWNAGSRNAKLADQYSKRLLVTTPGDATRSHLDAALDVCNAAIATQSDATGRVWDRLRERRDRIIVRQYAKPRTPPATTRNKRPARVNRYTVPPEPPASTPAKPARRTKSSRAAKAPR